MVNTTEARFCAIHVCDSTSGVWDQQCQHPPWEGTPAQLACLPPDCCPPSMSHPQECSVLVWKGNKSRSRPAEQKDILKTLNWKEKILSCIPESAIYHFSQVLHLHNLPTYKFSITFKNSYQEAYKTAMWNLFVSITLKWAADCPCTKSNVWLYIWRCGFFVLGFFVCVFLRILLFFFSFYY